MSRTWPAEAEDIVTALIEAHPGLKGTAARTIEWYDELAPTMFMSLLREALVERVRHGNDHEVQMILQDLDEAFVSGDSRARSEIAVGFLEGLPRSDEPGGEIRSMLGPALTAALDDG